MEPLANFSYTCTSVMAQRLFLDEVMVKLIGTFYQVSDVAHGPIVFILIIIYHRIDLTFKIFDLRFCEKIRGGVTFTLHHPWIRPIVT